jgi:hypothetical protein
LQRLNEYRRKIDLELATLKDEGESSEKTLLLNPQREQIKDFVHQVLPQVYGE